MDKEPFDPFDLLDNHESCYICNGYYGPNFNEPICSTCHLFLYPDEISNMKPDSCPSHNKDDGNDSGNECDCPQDNLRDISCCSYNSNSVPSSSNAIGCVQINIQNLAPRGHRRYNGNDDPDDDQSSDSLRPDEELPLNVQNHNEYRMEENRAYNQDIDGDFNDEDRDEDDDTYNNDEMEEDVEYNQQMDAEEDDDTYNDEPALYRRIEELSTYNVVGGMLLNNNRSIHCLPPEVLINIFLYLNDDLSLYSVSKVCKSWNTIITSSLITPIDWKYNVYKRFPLFKHNKSIQITNWYNVYCKLVETSNCYTCIQHMYSTNNISNNLYQDSTWRYYRLHKEYNDIKQDPPDGIQAQPLDNKKCHWMATIRGPVASPYEGGLFYLYIRIPFSYPMHPPKVKFITRIFHPNVSRHGDVGIDCIQHNWSLILTLNKVLISVQSLLTDPYCLVCMEPTIGELYQNNRFKFDEYARKCTDKYAILDSELY